MWVHGVISLARLNQLNARRVALCANGVYNPAFHYYTPGSKCCRDHHIPARVKIMKESQVVDRPHFQDTFWGFQGFPGEITLYVDFCSDTPLRLFEYELLQIRALLRYPRQGRNDRTGLGGVQLPQSLVSHWSLI